jgi:hypothetical protein
MDTSTMACYQSEALSFQHVSIERQIRETHQYPMEESIQQFFRDSPELCLNICLALEEKVKLTVAIFQKAMDKADQWEGGRGREGGRERKPEKERERERVSENREREKEEGGRDRETEIK